MQRIHYLISSGYSFAKFEVSPWGRRELSSSTHWPGQALTVLLHKVFSLGLWSTLSLAAHPVLETILASARFAARWDNIACCLPLTLACKAYPIVRRGQRNAHLFLHPLSWSPPHPHLRDKASTPREKIFGTSHPLATRMGDLCCPAVPFPELCEIQKASDGIELDLGEVDIRCSEGKRDVDWVLTCWSTLSRTLWHPKGEVLWERSRNSGYPFLESSMEMGGYLLLN